jgi:hypothetical protein
LAIVSNASSSDEFATPNLNEEQPIFDEYSDDEEQFSALLHMELLNNHPIYDSYKIYFWIDSEGDKDELQEQLILSSFPLITENQIQGIIESECDILKP